MHRQVDDNRDGATRCTQSCACACIHVLLCDAFPRTCPLMTSVNEAAILFSALCNSGCFAGLGMSVIPFEMTVLFHAER